MIGLGVANATSAPGDFNSRWECGGLAPDAVDLCSLGAGEVSLLVALDFFDFAGVVVPVLAADEGGRHEGKNISGLHFDKSYAVGEM